MDTAVSRALMISMLEEDELTRLHNVESRTGYLLPNWNIQQIFGKETIKDRYGLKSDEMVLQAYGEFIKVQLKRNNLYSREGDGFVGTGLETTHSFDWQIVKNKGKVIWEPSSAGKKPNSRVKAIKDAKDFFDSQN